MPEPSYDELLHKLIKQEEIEARLRESQELFRLAFHTNPDSINLNRASDGMYIDINQGFTSLMGYEREEVVGKTSIELNIWANPHDRVRLVEALRADGYVRNLEALFRKKNGDIGIGLMSASLLSFRNETVILSITRDITERKKADEKIFESEKRYRTLFETANIAVFVVEKKTQKILDANNAACQLTGRSMDELCRLFAWDLVENGTENSFAGLAEVTSASNFTKVTFIRPDRAYRFTSLSVVPLDDEKMFIIARDITNEVKLEEQFLQAQKMDALGKLAGGIAHDFNNLLVPIIGFSELGMNKIKPEDQFYANFEQIHDAGIQASNLTRQILAFCRKQVLELKTIDLNKVIEQFKKMLRRIISENIELKTIQDPSLDLIRADPSQIEQVLINLVINARDAMPGGGFLTIETNNVVLDENYVQKYLDVTPGAYVLLTVSDTGIGMDAATRAHIFEPFFSTKPMGKGTGLGLATVFGIVKQHNGHVWVYSEPGHGASFKIYFPRIVSRKQETEPIVTKKLQVKGSGTVLVVEDEIRVRRLICKTLDEHGFKVLEATNPTEGIERATAYTDKIHLLLSDVVMPQMNGRQLYEKLKSIHPESQVLYISGYTENIIVHQGILEENINFLQKPFTIESLAHKVYDIISA
jgi:two-component system cell cycle sensor histidine kinase/response regulator CckA